MALLSIGLALASGCTQIPDLAATVGDDLRDSDYPALVPLEGAIIPLPAPRDEAEKLEAQLTSRGDGLKSRARQMLAPSSQTDDDGETDG